MELDISMWMVWLILTVVLAIVEIFTSMAIALCIAVGTFCAFLISLFGVSFEMQILVLIVATIVAFISLIPLIRRVKGIHGASGGARSNMDALVGRQVISDADIPSGTIGRVKIDGDNWQVRMADSQSVSAGDRLIVCGYDSIILIAKHLS